MTIRKIDKNKLSRMLGQGKTLTQCAKHFGVSPAAVYKMKKKLVLERLKVLVAITNH